MYVCMYVCIQLKLDLFSLFFFHLIFELYSDAAFRPIL